MLKLLSRLAFIVLFRNLMNFFSIVFSMSLTLRILFEEFFGEIDYTVDFSLER